MNRKKRILGMNRQISRRDVLQGFGAAAAAAFTPGGALANQLSALETSRATAYPPALTGLRGSHAGSFEVAHELPRDGKRDWGNARAAESATYDLAVVGAGISGLAAAHYYRQMFPNARILLLDNHDDFGGHAKRNEFSVGDRTVIGYGGSQTLENPSDYSAVVKKFLQNLGVDINRFYAAYDQDFYRRNGLGGGVFFGRDAWGTDTLVRHDLANLSSYLPLASSVQAVHEAVSEMPISTAARDELLRFLTLDEDQIPDFQPDEKEDYLYSISYREFLSRHMGVSEPDVFRVFQDLTVDSCVGIEATRAGDAILYTGLPGAKAAGLPKDETDEPYIHHFPDGNASIARMLVRKLIPAVATGSTMDDIVTARFDYSQLDVPDARIRLRLNSTVVNAQHDGGAKRSKSVQLTYVKNGQAYKVRAKHCVMACYHAMIPSICSDLPEPQVAALAGQVKAPILYTNVMLKNWRAWKKLGIGAVVAPGSYHVDAMLDFPVSMGGYKFADDPDDPVVVHMERFLHRPNQELSRREQHRLGRHELLSTSFQTIERSVREQLAGILSGGDFDPARDIEAITVNRWAHGYSYSYDFRNEPYYERWDDERYPHVQARQPWGRISIANSDAGAEATIESAIYQAHRAVSELGKPD